MATKILDVRPTLATGGEPFAEIMAAAADVRPDEGLAVVHGHLHGDEMYGAEHVMVGIRATPGELQCGHDHGSGAGHV